MRWEQVLQYEAGNTIDTLRKKYKRLALQRHPDKGGRKENFQQLQAAWQNAQAAGGRPGAPPPRPTRPTRPGRSANRPARGSSAEMLWGVFEGVVRQANNFAATMFPVYKRDLKNTPPAQRSRAINDMGRNFTSQLRRVIEDAAFNATWRRVRPTVSMSWLSKKVSISFGREHRYVVYQWAPRGQLAMRDETGVTASRRVRGNVAAVNAVYGWLESLKRPSRPTVSFKVPRRCRGAQRCA